MNAPHEDIESFVLLLGMKQHPNVPLQPAAQVAIECLLERAGARAGQNTTDIRSAVVTYMRRYPDLETQVRNAVARAMDTVRSSDSNRASAAQAFFGNASSGRELGVI